MANGPNGSDEPTFIRITNAMVYSELQAVRADVRDLKEAVGDYPETKRRVRSLELRFYGVLAGMLGVLGLLAFGSPAAALGIGTVTIIGAVLGVAL